MNRLALSLLALCSLGSPFAKAHSAETRVTPVIQHSPVILYSNDVLGELEPCGCRSNPLGGMSRKANLLKKYPALQGEKLQLDAGDLLFSTGSVPETLRDQTLLQAEYLVDALNETGLDAAVPGEKDFALGVTSFKKLKSKAKFQYLAANLSLRGKPFLRSSLVVSRKSRQGKSIRVGVFGLVGEGLPFPKEFKIQNAIAAAKKITAELRGNSKVDLVVALTHQGLEKDRELAKQVPGIDLIIGGHDQSFLQSPLKIGKTWIYQASFRNQHLGIIPLALPFESQGHELVELSAEWASPESAPSSIDLKITQAKAKIAELNLLEEAKFSALVEKSAQSGANQFQTFPRCAECHIKQFDFWRKTPHANAFQPLFDQKQHLNKECLSCHTVGLGETGGWSQAAHLAERKKSVTTESSDPDSSNGFEPVPAEDLSAYLKTLHKGDTVDSSIKLDPRAPATSIKDSLGRLQRSWTPVQCENCHGAGQDHPFSAGPSLFKKAESSTCLKCHTTERAPGWYTASKQPDLEKIALKLKSMSCPSGD